MTDIKGAGCIKHIWMTTRCYAEKYLRKLVLEMYWNGEENPSVRVPIGDFFEIGHATCKHYVSLPPVKERLPRRWPEHGLWDR